MFIKKGGNYKTGTCRIRGMVGGDLQKQIDYDEGKTIEVTNKEYENIKKFNWCVSVKKPKNKG